MLETLVTDAITDTAWFDRGLMDESIEQEDEDDEALQEVADEM